MGLAYFFPYLTAHTSDCWWYGPYTSRSAVPDMIKNHSF